MKNRQYQTLEQGTASYNHRNKLSIQKAHKKIQKPIKLPFLQAFSYTIL